ncbi:MAG: hypothetical protein AAFZ92_00045 [Pseudomonadota bacterium]
MGHLVLLRVITGADDAIKDGWLQGRVEDDHKDYQQTVQKH